MNESTDRTLTGATGKRLAFAMGDAPFQSATVSVASPEDSERFEREKQQAALHAAQMEQQRKAQRAHFRPSADRLLVRPLKLGEKTETGLHRPESARYLTAEGIVLAVGPGARHPRTGERIAIEYAVDQRIKYSPYCGNGFELNGEDVLVLQERDVLGIIEAADGGN